MCAGVHLASAGVDQSNHRFLIERTSKEGSGLRLGALHFCNGEFDPGSD